MKLPKRLVPVSWTDEYVLKTKPQIRQRRDEQRQALGWIAKDLRTPELSLRVPVHIENKYFVSSIEKSEHDRSPLQPHLGF